MFDAAPRRSLNGSIGNGQIPAANIKYKYSNSFLFAISMDKTVDKQQLQQIKKKLYILRIKEFRL